MAETAVLASVRDKSGAQQVIALAGLELGRALPLAGPDAQLLVLSNQGVWLLVEAGGNRPARSHSLDYVAYSNVERLAMEFTDSARRAESPLDCMRGVRATLSYREPDGAVADIQIDGDVLVDAVHHDDDAPRLWGLISTLLQACASEGCSIAVSADAP